LGGDGVLSTPSMIAFMERASIQAYFARRAHYRRLRGARQAFRSHPKRQVTVRAELIEVDAGKLRFKAHDEHKKVGDGTHRRAIITIQSQG
jgi:predicted thioesterase